MAKFAALLAVTLSMMGIIYGSLVPPILPIKITVSLSADNQTITINKDQIGSVALPLNTLCNLPLVDTLLTCGVCHQDCIFVHNALGGTCAPDPEDKTKDTCLCAYTPEDAEERGISYDTLATCKITNPLYEVAADTFAVVLRARMFAVQCYAQPNGTFISNGCSTDCSANHAEMGGGDCEVTTPLQPKAGSDPCLHCQCKK